MDKLTKKDSSKLTSESLKYDIVFIGGGPATLSFISYLFQQKYAQKVFSTTRVLVIEKTDNFGSGILGGYAITTNTESHGFSRLVCDPSKFHINYKDNQEASSSSESSSTDKEKESNDEDFDDPDIDHSVFEPLPGFKEIFECASTQSLIKGGVKCAPLTLVGYYLDCVGNYFIDVINKKYNQNIFLSKTKVESIKMFKNDEYSISVKKVDETKSYNIRCKNLILATGGKPKAPKNLPEIQKLLVDPLDFYYSNDMLQEDGYKRLMQSLSKKESKVKKIVIIGGSHSGFSAAWILLNKPRSYNLPTNLSDYQPKVLTDCEACKSNNSSCYCLGRVYNKLWNFNPEFSKSTEDLELLKSSEDFEYEITMLYIDQIRVFFLTEQEALKEGYTQFNPKTDMNNKGKIFPFIGLRADAKSLYFNVVRGNEKRMTLVKTKTFEDQAKYIKGADAVIWACGYETELIPTLDWKDNPVNFCIGEDGLFDIDMKQRLMNKNKMPFKNIFGIGQGYAAFAKEVINGIKARGDSVHLYNTLTSKRLYKSLEDFIFKQIYEANKNPKLSLVQSKSGKGTTTEKKSKPLETKKSEEKVKEDK